MRIRGILLALSLAVPLGTAAAADPPHVVVSIAPVHSLVAQVMAGVGEPALLLPANVSEHDYALKPSDARAIAAADLVVWMGEALETYLAEAVENGGRPHLTLLEAPGIDPLPYGDAQAGEDDHAAEAEEHGHAAGDHEAGESAGRHDHHGLDPHVWLDPIRAQAIVRAAAERLSEIDPGNADAYRRNAERAVADLAALDAEVRARLAPHARAPFLAFHDAYGYFVRRYGLAQAGEVTLDPQRRPGARGVTALAERIAEEGVVCAFAEPQFDDRLVRRLAEETGIRVGRLDPLGQDLEPGPGLYSALIRRNVDAITACLSNSP